MSLAPFRGKITFGEIKNKLLDAARQGLSERVCARLAGIDPNTLSKYLKEGGEWKKAFEEARAEGAFESVVKLDKIADKCGPGSFQAVQAKLKALGETQFGDTSQTNVNVNVMVPLFEGQFEKSLQPFIEVIDGKAEESGDRAGDRDTDQSAARIPETANQHKPREIQRLETGSNPDPRLVENGNNPPA